MTASYVSHAAETNYNGLMTCSDSTHVVEIEHNAPVSVSRTATGRTTLEFKNNVAGYISFRVSAHEGDKIRNPIDGTTFRAAMNHIYTVKVYELLEAAKCD